jgi:hypothetical protein
MPKMNTTEVDNYLLPPRMLSTQVEMVNNNIKVIKATTPIRLRTIPNDISLASLISFFYCENYNLTAWYRSILIYLTCMFYFLYRFNLALLIYASLILSCLWCNTSIFILFLIRTISYT